MSAFNDPLVSIITPTYNHQSYIVQCIESVIHQTYHNWELIVIDDGSTDNTKQIVESFCEKDTRIKYFYQENIGLKRLGETYNTALNKSKGEYVAILESDDYWFANKLQTQVNQFAENPNLVLCWSRVQVWLDDLKHLLDYPRFYEKSKLSFYSNLPNGNVFNMLFEDFPVPLSWMIKKRNLDEIGGFQQSLEMPTVDLNTLLILSLKGEFGYINEPLGVYRKQQNQATSVHIMDIAEGKARILLHYYDQLNENQKKIIRFTRKQIKSKLAENNILALSKQGRGFLVQKKYSLARKSYIKSIIALGSFSFLWRFRSLLGLAFSVFHMDVEGLAKFLGKETLKPDK